MPKQTEQMKSVGSLLVELQDSYERVKDKKRLTKEDKARMETVDDMIILTIVQLDKIKVK